MKHFSFRQRSSNLSFNLIYFKRSCSSVNLQKKYKNDAKTPNELTIILNRLNLQNPYDYWLANFFTVQNTVTDFVFFLLLIRSSRSTEVLKSDVSCVVAWMWLLVFKLVFRTDILMDVWKKRTTKSNHQLLKRLKNRYHAKRQNEFSCFSFLSRFVVFHSKKNKYSDQLPIMILWTCCFLPSRVDEFINTGE